MFVIAVVILVVSLLAIGYGVFTKEGLPVIAGALGALVAIGLGIMSCMYSQEQSEAKVIKSVSGEVTAVDTTQGFGFKSPLDSIITFDIRDQQALYKGDGNPTTEGESVNGPQITIQDKDKVSADVDIAIGYSIDPDKVGEIYSNYSSQENFVARKIDQDMRSVVRNSFSAYTTAGVLENRAKLETDIGKALSERWKDSGIIVTNTALQGIRYPEATQNGFTQAQESATNLKRAQEDLKVKEAEGAQRKATAQADAEVRRINAEAEAKANETLNKSLTDSVLQKQYIDALKDIGKDGNLVVVPEGSQPMVGAKPKE